jgi:hypothetical protein
MSNLDFSQDEIIENITEDIKEFMHEDELDFFQAISKIIVEYDQLIRHSEENKRNIFTTLKVLCIRENSIHPHVEKSIKEIKNKNELLRTISDKLDHQSPPPALSNQY